MLARHIMSQGALKLSDPVNKGAYGTPPDYSLNVMH